MSAHCWFGHAYEPIAGYLYIDTSWGMRQPTTNVTNRCSRCGHLQFDQLVAGHHDLGDLRVAAGLDRNVGKPTHAKATTT